MTRRVILESKGPGYSITLATVGKHVELSAAGIIDREEVERIRDRLTAWLNNTIPPRWADGCPPGLFCVHDPKCPGAA